MRDERVLKIRKLFMIIAVIIHAYHIFIIVRRFVLNQDIQDWMSPYILVFIVGGFIRLIMDMYIFITSFKYFVFLLRRRIQRYHSKGKKVPLKSKLKMIWAALVVFLVGFEVTSIFVASIFLPSKESKIFITIMSYQRYVMFPVLELIFASTITYIFYEQGLLIKN